MKKSNAISLLSALALLCGCVPPQKIEQVQADAAKVEAQRKERESIERCAQIAAPGTPQHLACRLATGAH